jgi:N-acetylneuraminic acid mutarotase
MRSFIFIFLISLTLMAGCTKTTESEDDLAGNWVRRSDFEGRARAEAVVAVTNDGRVFTGLGFDGTNRLIDFWEYSSEDDAWYNRKDFPGTPRNSAVSFQANNKIFVGLGYDGVNYLKDLWRYDPSSDSWEQMADFPSTGRWGAVGFSINDKGYVSSGYDGNYLKDFWEYDPSLNLWTKRTSPGGSKRNDAVAFVIDGKAYLCTGINNGEYVNDLYVYDPTTDAWASKRKLTNAEDDFDFDDDYLTIVRTNAVAFTLNGKGYITTGLRSSLVNNTWEYDPATDLWMERTAFEGTGREGAIGFSVNDRAYVGLGKSSSLRFDDLREFIPGADYDEND